MGGIKIANATKRLDRYQLNDKQLNFLFNNFEEWMLNNVDFMMKAVQDSVEGFGEGNLDRAEVNEKMFQYVFGKTRETEDKEIRIDVLEKLAFAGFVSFLKVVGETMMKSYKFLDDKTKKEISDAIDEIKKRRGE